MSEISTPIGSFPAAPADASAPAVLLWVVTVLVVLLGVVCVLLWQRIQREADACQKANAEARKEAVDARDLARQEAEASRAKIEDLYRQAIDQMAERETRLVSVVQANTEVMLDIKQIGSGYYRTLREQRLGGPHGPDRQNPRDG